jgi:hypothetical protein
VLRCLVIILDGELGVSRCGDVDVVGVEQSTVGRELRICLGLWQCLTISGVITYRSHYYHTFNVYLSLPLHHTTKYKLNAIDSETYIGLMNQIK